MYPHRCIFALACQCPAFLRWDAVDFTVPLPDCVLGSAWHQFLTMGRAVPGTAGHFPCVASVSSRSTPPVGALLFPVGGIGSALPRRDVYCPAVQMPFSLPVCAHRRAVWVMCLAGQHRYPAHDGQGISAHREQKKTCPTSGGRCRVTF